MSNSKCTPWPWRKGKEIKDGRFIEVEIVSGMFRLGSIGLNMADTGHAGCTGYDSNLNLVLAAPEMLEALELVVKSSVGPLPGEQVQSFFTVENFEVIKAAISKAKGGV